MKKYPTLIALCLLLSNLSAQDDAQLTQFYANLMFYNPASTGFSDKLSAAVAYRSQWAGSPELSKKDRPTYVALNATQYLADYRSGIGLTIYNASQHVQNSLQAKVSYAYHLQVDDEASLALGLNVGMLSRSIKDGITIGGEAPINQGYVMSDLGLGVEYYTPELHTGLSVQHLPTVIGGKENRKHTHFYYYATYRYTIDHEWQVIPSVFLRNSSVVTNVDITARVSYLNMFQLGAAWRRDAMAILVGVSYQDTYSLGYSFDIQTSSLKGARPSHEIVLGYKVQVLKKQDPTVDRRMQRL